MRLEQGNAQFSRCTCHMMAGKANGAGDIAFQLALGFEGRQPLRCISEATEALAALDNCKVAGGQSVQECKTLARSG